MRRVAVRFLLPALVCFALSCGGGTFFFSTNGSGISFVAVSGTVGTAQLSTLNTGQITVVTLFNDGIEQTFTFCDNVVGLFPSNVFVTVRFAQNGACENVVQVNVN